MFSASPNNIVHILDIERLSAIGGPRTKAGDDASNFEPLGDPVFTMKYTLALLLAAIFSFGALTNASATTIIIGEGHHHHHHHHGHHHR